MCQACGFYNGRIVIDLQAKADKREARMTAKKEAIVGQQTAAAEAEAENGGAPAPEQAEKLEAVNNAALEKKAQNASVAKAVQKPQTAK